MLLSSKKKVPARIIADGNNVCCHFNCIKSTLMVRKVVKGLSKCTTCQEKKNMGVQFSICLSCGHIGCQESHMNHTLTHFRQNLNHTIVLDMLTFQLKCMACGVNYNPQVLCVMKKLLNKVRAYRAAFICSELYLQTISRVPRGIKNLGFTCYMNSVLQALFVMDKFRDTLITSCDELQVSMSPSARNNAIDVKVKEPYGPVSLALKDLFSELLFGTNGKEMVPREFQASLLKHLGQFTANAMHDSHEFLLCLLERVSQEIQERITSQLEKTKLLTAKDSEFANKCTTELFPQSLFYGELVSEINCQECKTKTVNIEHFIDISLPIFITKKRARSSLMTMLNNIVSRGSKYHEARVSSNGLVNGHHKACDPSGKNFVVDDRNQKKQTTEREDLFDVKTGVDLLPPKRASSSPVATTDSSPKQTNITSDSPQNLSSEKENNATNSLRLTENTVSRHNKSESDFTSPKKSQSIGTKKSHNSFSDEFNFTNSSFSCATDSSCPKEEATPDEEEDENFPCKYEDAPECDIYHCLNKFFAVENLDGSNQIVCNHCSEIKKEKFYSDATKKFRIRKLPNHLIVHLKRFKENNHRYTKLNDHIRFPETLEMHDYCYKKLSDTEPKYQLCCVVEHNGSLSNGHYISYIRYPADAPLEDQHWFIANDNIIKTTTFETVAKSNAYLLFYNLIRKTP